MWKFGALIHRDAAEAVTKRIIQTCAEFKPCIWIKRYMIQEERTIPPLYIMAWEEGSERGLVKATNGGIYYLNNSRGEPFFTKMQEECFQFIGTLDVLCLWVTSLTPSLCLKPVTALQKD